MIIREKYLKVIRGFYDSDLIKVITGVRRCGKFVILETIMNEIKKKTENIIYLNFEKMTDFDKASYVKSLINYVKNLLIERKTNVNIYYLKLLFCH